MGNGMWGTNEELDLSTHVCHEAVSATLVLEGVKKKIDFFSSSMIADLSMGFSIYFKETGECLTWGKGGYDKEKNTMT